MKIQIFASHEANFLKIENIVDKVNSAQLDIETLLPEITYEVFQVDGFWELYYALSINLKNGQTIKLSSEDITILRNCAVVQRDAENTFNHVAALCELTNQKEKMENAGFYLWLRCEW